MTATLGDIVSVYHANLKGESIDSPHSGFNCVKVSAVRVVPSSSQRISVSWGYSDLPGSDRCGISARILQYSE